MFLLILAIEFRIYNWNDHVTGILIIEGCRMSSLNVILCDFACNDSDLRLLCDFFSYFIAFAVDSIVNKENKSNASDLQYNTKNKRARFQLFCARIVFVSVERNVCADKHDM